MTGGHDGSRVETTSDNDLMRRVRDGDLGQLAVLFERHHRSLFQFFLHLTGRRETSEDLVQDVFVRLLKYRHTFHAEAGPSGSFAAWMYQVARNAHMDHWRKRKGEASLPDDAWEGAVSHESRADENLQRQQEADLLRRALESLPVERREVLVLSRFQNRKYEEIAAMTGVEVGTVKTRVFRALRDLGQAYHALAGGRV